MFHGKVNNCIVLRQIAASAAYGSVSIHSGW